MSIQAYNKAFGVYSTKGMFVQEGINGNYTINKFPEYLGKTVSFEIFDEKFPQYKYPKRDFVLKGIILDDSNKQRVIVSDNAYYDIFDYANYNNYIVNRDSIKSLGKFLDYATKVMLDRFIYLVIFSMLMN